MMGDDNRIDKVEGTDEGRKLLAERLAAVAIDAMQPSPHGIEARADRLIAAGATGEEPEILGLDLATTGESVSLQELLPEPGEMDRSPVGVMDGEQLRTWSEGAEMRRQQFAGELALGGPPQVVEKIDRALHDAMAAADRTFGRDGTRILGIMMDQETEEALRGCSPLNLRDDQVATIYRGQPLEVVKSYRMRGFTIVREGDVSVKLDLWRGARAQRLALLVHRTGAQSGSVIASPPTAAEFAEMGRLAREVLGLA